MNRKKKEELEKLLLYVYKKAREFEEKNCFKCNLCFRDDGVFRLESIEKCRKAPDIFKIYYRLKNVGVIIAEKPFLVDLK